MYHIGINEVKVLIYSVTLIYQKKKKKKRRVRKDHCKMVTEMQD